MKLFLFLSALIIGTTTTLAQYGGRQQGRSLTVHFYGKVIDASTGKPVEFAPVQLFQTKHDSITNTSKEVLVGGQLSEANGDFSIENVPISARFTLKIAALGYETYSETISPEAPSHGSEKDLGNIKLKLVARQLSEVKIDGSEPSFRLEIDKKVYNVEKDQISSGGNGEDVLKNIPSVSVDIDGNISLRNASPQVFVDGRPTTLTADQLPADAIESVEIITNPSAKYDASDGGGGIINIVLKKNRKIGYNGSLRAGVDMRGKLNAGLDLNAREKKLNFFASGYYSQRRSLGTGNTERFNTGLSPQTNIFQKSETESDRFFSMGRGGVDYFIDNRNTLTLSGSFHRGSFATLDDLDIHTDTLSSTDTQTSFSNRVSNSKRSFYYVTTSLLYKRLFPKAGRELTGDVSYSTSENDNEGNFETQYYDVFQSPTGVKNQEQQLGDGGSNILTAQSDFVNPLKDKNKIETGVRAMLRSYRSSNESFLYNQSSGQFERINAASSDYIFDDYVYAGYVTYTGSLKKLGYQGGLRMESSSYKGELPDSNKTFRNQYPISLFPSGFLSYKMNDKNDFQLNYTRRVYRPAFLQLIPFTDYSDSLNLSRGNASLKPEFTHSMEFSYQRVFNKSNTFLASLYLKNTNDLITRYQVSEYDSMLNRSVIISTYENADASYAYGMELTTKNSISKWLDLTFNVNFYNSVINASNIETGLHNEMFSWFTKLNLTFKLPYDFNIQLSGDYRSRSAMPIGQGGGRGASWFGAPPSTVQGYTEPNYELDVSVKKDFLKNKAASVTLSVSDVFKTDVDRSYSTSYYFTQTSSRQRDQQLFRLNLSYRFGKADASLFKRKNMRSSTEGVEMGM